MKNRLRTKTHDRSAAVAVIGLASLRLCSVQATGSGQGYVGLPLAVAFAESGFPVVGIDVDPSKVDAISQGRSCIGDIPSDRLAPLTITHYPFTINHSPASALTTTTDHSLLAGCDQAIICVPTPLERELQFA